ncbi:MAG: general secretion pathway protein GspB [Thermodesulfobacteriota bacterium]
MSYILEALKKSDQERRRGQVPDLRTVQGSLSTPAPQRSRWVLVAAGLVLLFGGNVLVVWWLRPWAIVEPAAEGVSTGPPVAMEPPRLAATSPLYTPAPAAGRTVPDKSLATPPVEPAAPLAFISEPVVAAPLAAAEPIFHPVGPAGPEGGAAPAAEPPAVVDATAPGPTIQSFPDEEVLAAQEADTGIADDTFMPEPADAMEEEEEEEGLWAAAGDGAGAGALEAPIAPPAPASAARTPPAAAGAAHDGGGPAAAGAEVEPMDIRQLPLSVRHELPDIAIALHRYSRDAASRLVSINGRVLRPGDQVREGLLLEAITPSGVVLSFQGYRFHKRVL